MSHQLVGVYIVPPVADIQCHPNYCNACDEIKRKSVKSKAKAVLVQNQ